MAAGRRPTGRPFPSCALPPSFPSRPCLRAAGVPAWARLWHDWNARGYAERGEGVGRGAPAPRVGARRRGAEEQANSPLLFRVRGCGLCPEVPHPCSAPPWPLPRHPCSPNPVAGRVGRGAPDPGSAGGPRNGPRKMSPGEPLSVGPPRPPLPVFLPVTRPRPRGRGAGSDGGGPGRGGGCRGGAERSGFWRLRAAGGPRGPSSVGPVSAAPAGAAGLATPSARWPRLVLSPVGGGRRACSGPHADCRAARGGKCLIKPPRGRPTGLSRRRPGVRAEAGCGPRRVSDGPRPRAAPTLTAAPDRPRTDPDLRQIPAGPGRASCPRAAGAQGGPAAGA